MTNHRFRYSQDFVQSTQSAHFLCYPSNFLGFCFSKLTDGSTSDSSIRISRTSYITLTHFITFALVIAIPDSDQDTAKIINRDDHHTRARLRAQPQDLQQDSCSWLNASRIVCSELKSWLISALIRFQIMSIRCMVSGPTLGKATIIRREAIAGRATDQWSGVRNMI